ncbi:MAG: flagellar basal-body rod modification protein FlgD [Cognaticolwellia sp.]|jgi:flagellar basal-body rod modification protein FlgD
MSLSGISGLADQSALDASGVTTSGSSAMGQETFLNLLTTQMQNQDPLSPMANEDFIAQLATFSSLEQLMDIGDAMKANTLSMANLSNTTMASLVGKHVVAIGDTFPRAEGETGDTVLHYDSPQAASATLNIYDEDGKVVWSEPVSLQAGEETLKWDGKDLSGQLVEPGDYRFELTATDSSGNNIEISERVSGMVDSMDYSTGSPQPTVNGVAVSLSDLIRLTAGEEGA